MEMLSEWDKKIEKINEMIKMQGIVMDGLKEEKMEYEELREHELDLIYGNRSKKVNLINNVMTRITGGN